MDNTKNPQTQRDLYECDIYKKSFKRKNGFNGSTLDKEKNTKAKEMKTIVQLLNILENTENIKLVTNTKRRECDIHSMQREEKSK